MCHYCGPSRRLSGPTCGLTPLWRSPMLLLPLLMATMAHSAMTPTHAPAHSCCSKISGEFAVILKGQDSCFETAKPFNWPLCLSSESSMPHTIVLPGMTSTVSSAKLYLSCSDALPYNMPYNMRDCTSPQSVQAISPCFCQCASLLVCLLLVQMSCTPSASHYCSAAKHDKMMNKGCALALQASQWRHAAAEPRGSGGEPPSLPQEWQGPCSAAQCAGLEASPHLAAAVLQAAL